VPPSRQDPAFGGPDDDGPDGSSDDFDVPLRGWIDPEDRLWRHPSELESLGLGAQDVTPAPSLIHYHRSKTMVLVGAGAVLAAVAWVIILLSPSSDHPTVANANGAMSDAPLTTLASNTQTIPSAANAAGQSLVQLRASTSHGEVSLVGVAVAEGGLVATTANGLSGLRSLGMVGSDGKLLRASVVGIDRDSDVALVNVPDDVPVAPFADDNSLGTGSGDMTLSMTTSRSTDALKCTPGAITAIGIPIASGEASGMPAITSSVARPSFESGDPLLNDSGEVIGILYNSPNPAPTFLPAQLVLGVSDDLRSAGRVTHGWLGVEGTDGSGTGGAVVSSIMAGSPAASSLRPGEIITKLGSYPIRSMAELRARLYVLAPDTKVVLSVVNGTATRVVAVTLSPSP
jgi:S1-C subfamily serine protease